jgi:hypothetical protein
VDDSAVYITSLDEVFWGLLLIALTMVIHGVGVAITLRVGQALQRHAQGASPLHGISALVVATWILVIVHLIEIVAWGGFLLGRGAFENLSTAIYYSLMQYTTVSSELRLPYGLRLLGGIIPLSGLITVAWSTGVLFALAQRFQARYEEAARPPRPES